MAEALFPQRERCKTCRSGLGKVGAPVYLGLYCTPKCAQRADVPATAAAAPRECVTYRDGVTVFKRRYRSVTEIPDKIADDPSVSNYWCGACHHLHIGHTRMGTSEQFRMFMAPGDVSDVLRKLRGQATVAQVAKAARVRPIRLTELEAGTAHEEGLATLLKVLPVLQSRLGVTIKR